MCLVDIVYKLNLQYFLLEKPNLKHFLIQNVSFLIETLDRYKCTHDESCLLVTLNLIQISQLLKNYRNKDTNSVA